MANPNIPVQATFPISPPLAKLPIGFIDPNNKDQVLPSILFLKQYQQMWAAIAGSGGSVENIDLLFSLAQSPAFENSSPEDAALPYQIAALQIPRDATDSQGYVPYFPSDLVPEYHGAQRQNYFYQVPLTGFSITVPDGITNLIMNPAGLLATGTITMPKLPFEGQICGLASSQGVTTLTMNPNTGQTLNGGLTTIAANGFARYQYIQPVATWFRIG